MKTKSMGHLYVDIQLLSTNIRIYWKFNSSSINVATVLEIRIWNHICWKEKSMTMIIHIFALYSYICSVFHLFAPLLLIDNTLISWPSTTLEYTIYNTSYNYLLQQIPDTQLLTK